MKKFVYRDLTGNPQKDYCTLRERFHRENDKFDFRELKFDCGMVRMVELVNNDGNLYDSFAEIITNVPKERYDMTRKDLMGGAKYVEAENFDRIPREHENLFLLGSKIPVNFLRYNFPPDLVKQAEEFYKPFKVPEEYDIPQEIDHEGNCTFIMAKQEDVDREMKNLEQKSFTAAFQATFNIAEFSSDPGPTELKDGNATHYILEPEKL